MPALPEVIKITTDPAAGAELSYTADEDMVVHSLTLSLATSAVVATRRVVIVADDGANTFFRVAAPDTQLASLTRTYCAYEGATSPGAANQDGEIALPLPSLGLRLRKGDRLRTVTVAKDAGDNYTSAFMQVERPGQAGLT